jgi:hypothetical protein
MIEMAAVAAAVIVGLRRSCVHQVWISLELEQ